LIYCRSGNTKPGEEELGEAQKLKPNNLEIQMALTIPRTSKAKRYWSLW
jgi:hypothetical protein